MGRLFCLSPSDFKTWMLSIDTKNSLNTKASLRSEEEAHWIVGISRGYAMSTICKGREKVDRQPRTSPKPLLTQLELGTGLLLHRSSGGNTSGSDQLSTLEGHFLKAATSFSQQRRYEHESGATILSGAPLVKQQSILDSKNLKLMQSCLIADNSTMALDLVSRLHTERSFVIAMSIARNYKQETLASKIYELMQMKMEAILKVHQDQVNAASEAVDIASSSSLSSAAPSDSVSAVDDVDMNGAVSKQTSSSASIFARNLKRKRTKAATANVDITPNEKKDVTEPPLKKTTRKVSFPPSFYLL
jgi:hypothetical protein